MNKKEEIWNFFLELEKNNSKDWMDENRKRYHTVKGYWLEEVDAILKKLIKHDKCFEQFKPKDLIMPITNNRMFHPDKPLYRCHFACSPFSKEKKVSPFFFSFGPEFTLLGGGLYRPDKEALTSVRDAIDYDASKLIAILENKDFKRLFGGLAKDESELKTSPRGYDKNHPHIDLIRRKNFTATIQPKFETIINGNISDIIEEAYLTLQPLLVWFDKALTA